MSIHDAEAERGVLGCILAGESPELARVLTPGDFFTPAHRWVWEGVLELLASGKPVDELTVADRLKASGHLAEIGGPAWVMGLAQSAPISANLAAYVEIIRDRSLRRGIVEKCRQTALAALRLDADASTVALGGSAALAQLGAAGALELPTLEKAFGDVLDQLQANANGTRVGAYKTGVGVWDEMLGGVPRGYLTLIGAAPGVGKSALKNRILINMARAGIKVGTFELEDPATALVYRVIARETGIPVRKLRTERLPSYQMEVVGAAVEREFPWSRNVIYECRSGLTAQQLAATARQMVVQRGCQVIFIDHFGEINFGSTYGRIDFDMEQGISCIRNVARDLDVVVVGLVHFHRPKGSDAEPRYIRPTSSAWKNSGGYEQTARVAVGLWRTKDSETDVIATVTKQNEGEQDFDFAMTLHKSSGLIESDGGRKREGTTGYTEGEKQ